MRILNATEIGRMITNTSCSFSDTCTINTKSVTRNGYGEEIATFTAGSSISCGFELLNGDEQPSQELIVSKTRGIFKLPITSTLTIEDRITLTKRYDKTVSYVFEIKSEPVKNFDCILVQCEYVGV